MAFFLTHEWFILKIWFQFRYKAKMFCSSHRNDYLVDLIMVFCVQNEFWIRNSHFMVIKWFFDLKLRHLCTDVYGLILCASYYKLGIWFEWLALTKWMEIFCFRQYSIFYRPTHATKNAITRVLTHTQDVCAWSTEFILKF